MTYLSSDEPSPRAPTFDTLLVLDASASMTGPAFQELKDVALSYVNSKYLLFANFAPWISHTSYLISVASLLLCKYYLTSSKLKHMSTAVPQKSHLSLNSILSTCLPSTAITSLFVSHESVFRI